MTSIPPSQEAREAAADLQELRVALNTGRGLKDSATVYRFQVLLDTFEAQIEARRTPPSDELRRRIEDLISAAMNSAITEEWEVARHTADSIIALLPGGEHRCQCGFPWGADPVRHAEFCDNRTEAPTIPTDLVESEAPWCDAKVAFGWNPPEACLDNDDYGGLGLLLKQEWPAGWEVCEVDGAGARYVAVFRIDGVPSTADGQAVAALLDAIEGKKS